MAAVRFAVGEAHYPHRAMIERMDGYMNQNGWTHKLAFYAYPIHKAGTTKFSVYEAHAPHRVNIVTEGGEQQAAAHGWTHKLTFYAYAKPQPGAVPFAVGEAHAPHRAMISQSDVDMDVNGWTHQLMFYAYLQPATVEAQGEQCVICCDNPRVYAALPCGHLFACEVCAASAIGGALDRCPLCRTRLTERRAIRIFS